MSIQIQNDFIINVCLIFSIYFSVLLYPSDKKTCLKYLHQLHIISHMNILYHV